MTYLDNAATTRPYPEVLERMHQVADEWYANPHALHQFGVEAERLVTGARQEVATCLGVTPSEIFFTSGGTESNNTVLRGLSSWPKRLGRHVLTTSVEHPAVLEPLAWLTQQGFEVEYLPVGSDGLPDVEAAASRIRADTCLLAMMLVNNETGGILPLAETTRLARQRNPGIAVFTDAVQAVGKIHVKPEALGADYLSLSAHKFHGPMGVGALYVKKGARLSPFMVGGGQENGRRSGTLNVPGICGLATALTLREARLTKDLDHLSSLKQRLMNGLVEGLGEEVRMLSPSCSVPHILQTGFAGVKSEVLLHHLAEREIWVSTGSACSSRKDTRSHVVKAMDVPQRFAHGVLRVSLCGENTEKEVDLLLAAILDIVPRIRIKKR